MPDPAGLQRAALLPCGGVVNGVVSGVVDGVESGSGGAVAPGVVAVAAVLTVAVAAATGWLIGRASTAPELRALRWAATHDLLTGLANRAGLRAAAAGTPQGPGRVALMVLDLDGFKGVNDVYGHAAGDAVLAQVARRLRGWVRSTASPATLAARLSGDEFAVLLTLPADRSEADAVAHRAAAAVHRTLCQPCVLPALPRAGPTTVSVGVSIGVSTSTGMVASGAAAGPGGALDALLVRADAAMYEAKSSGDGWRIAGQPSGGGLGAGDRHEGRTGVGATGRTLTAATTASAEGDAGSAGGARLDAPLYGRRPAAAPMTRCGRAAGPPHDGSIQAREAS